MGTSCSAVVPLNPTALAAACDEAPNTAEWRSESDSDGPGSPLRRASSEWPRRGTWLSTASHDSTQSLDSAASPGTVDCGVGEDPGRPPAPARRRHSTAAKPALRRSSMLTFKLRSAREAQYLAPAPSPTETPRRPRRSVTFCLQA
eukprot:EG_transcript_13824